MEAADRLNQYLGYVEVSRKWIAVMDTKAGFLSALNAALLAFVWTGAKLASEPGPVGFFSVLASIFAVASLVFSLRVVMPRGSLKAVFGTPSKYTEGFKAISFYGFVADTYPKGADAQFFRDVDAMNEEQLAREALEQHFTVSHVVRMKEKGVTQASGFLVLALFCAGLSLAIKALAVLQQTFL